MLLKIRDALETHIKDVPSILVETHSTFEPDQLPAIGVFMAENTVIARASHEDPSAEKIEQDSSGTFFLKDSKRCCLEETKRRQYYNIEIAVEQCNEEGAARCAFIGNQLEECLRGINLHYDGFFTLREQQSQRSSQFHTRQYRFYIEYTKIN